MRFSQLVAPPQLHVKEGSMQPTPRRHRDLFDEERETPPVRASLRSALVPLIERLLIEALAGNRSEADATTPAPREAAHEQDHA